jgi:catechol 2,3-dioxygenase-like lactoylglutathione lyase family enzyme
MPLLDSSPIMAFSATAGAERAKKFYRDQLGLKLVEDSQFALVFDAAGTMLPVQRVKEALRAQYTMLGA